MRFLLPLFLSQAAHSLFLSRSPASSAILQAQTDTLLFNTPIHSFYQTRNAALAATANGKATERTLAFDWDSDGCSSSPDKPFGFDFTRACLRHDFGYRNYKKQGRFNESNRLRLDKNLFKDMKDVCKKEPGFAGKACGKIAKGYYDAVRQFGKDAKKLSQALERTMVMAEEAVKKAKVERWSV